MMGKLVINFLDKKNEKVKRKSEKLTNLQNVLENDDIDAIVRLISGTTHEKINVNYEIRNKAAREEMSRFFESGLEALEILKKSSHDWNK